MRRPGYDLVLVVEDRGHKSHGIGWDEIERFPVRRGSTGLELRIPRRAERPFLIVRVEDEGGRPVRRAILIVDVVGNFSGVGHRMFPVRDGYARCRLWRPASRVILTVGNADAEDGTRLGRITDGPFPVTPEPIRIRLPVGRTLRVRVVTPEGEGVECAEVEAKQPTPFFSFHGGWQFRVICFHSNLDPDGRIDFTDLGPGPVDLRVRTGGGGKWVHRPDTRIPADRSEVTIVLERGVFPEIRVVDPNGQPVMRGVISVRRGFRRLADDWLEHGVARPGPISSDETYTLMFSPAREDCGTIGRAGIREWTPGATTLSVPWAEPPAEPDAGDESTPDARPDPTEGPVLWFRIPCVKKWSSLSCFAEIVPDGGGAARQLSVSLPEDGIRGLDPQKTYTLRVVGIGDGLAVEASGLRPRPGSSRLVAKKGLRITGRVELPRGADSVSLRVGRGQLLFYVRNSAVIRRDGTFEVFGLLPGNWILEASVRANGRWYEGKREARAGGPPVTIPVRRLSD